MRYATITAPVSADPVVLRCVGVNPTLTREIAMRGLIGTLLLMLASGWSAAVGQDANTRTVNSILPHCIAGLAADAQDVTGGRCAGIIATLSFVSRVLPDDLKFCHPSTATPEQMVQVVAG